MVGWWQRLVDPPQKLRGGVHPDGRKHSAAEAIERLPLPPRLYLPLQQHIGAPAEVCVEVGETVGKGQLLARSQGPVSAPVHAPAAGVIAAIADYPAPHPSGLPVRTVMLDTAEPGSVDPISTDIDTAIDTDTDTDGEEIAVRVAAAGIVGMGGATFPAAVKLKLGQRAPIHTLVINGVECEPFLTCDDRLMRERGAAIIGGVRLMAKALGAGKIVIAVENNKPEAQQTLIEASQAAADIEIVGVPIRYPMGSEKHLVQYLTGRETPAQSLTADLGVVVHNVATAYAVYRAVRHREPLISRVVTVSGGAIARQANVEVPLGTRITDLIDYLGGFIEPPARLLAGGPMMGQMLPHAEVPLVKGSSGVLALTEAEVAAKPVQPCIRCASCVDACPCGLTPLALAARARANDLDGAARLGLLDCVACGACAYVCPSHIPLVQYFRFAKGALAAKQREAQHAERTKQLAQQRQARLQREAAAKAQKAATRKKPQQAAAS